MRKHGIEASIGIFAAALLASAGSLAAPEASPSAGTARVWFLWLSYSIVGYDTGAVPTIYANGVPVGSIRGGAEFARDFPPGTYRFSIDPYGLPTGQALTVQLTPGNQTFLQVQWSPTWEQGVPGGRGMMASSFFLAPMSPQLAQAYLPTLANMGR